MRQRAAGVEVTGERAQAVGVERHGPGELLHQRARRRGRLLVEPDPRPEGDGVALRRQLRDDLARLQRERARAGFG